MGRRIVCLIDQATGEHLGHAVLNAARRAAPSAPSDLLAVAQAAGVLADTPVPYRPTGQQPPVEMTGGPTTLYGQVATDDEYLEHVINSWTRQEGNR